jgi:hypothetical protein
MNEVINSTKVDHFTFEDNDDYGIGLERTLVAHLEDGSRVSVITFVVSSDEDK